MIMNFSGPVACWFSRQKSDRWLTSTGFSKPSMNTPVGIYTGWWGVADLENYNNNSAGKNRKTGLTTNYCLLVKGHFTDFTHKGQFTQDGVYNSVCKVENKPDNIMH